MSTLIGPAAAGFPTRSRTKPRSSSADYWGKRVLALILIAWAAGYYDGFQTSVTLLFALGLGAAIFGLRRPMLGMLGIIVLCVLDPIARFYLLNPSVLRWNTLNYWLLIVMIVYAPLLLRLKDPHTRVLKWLILLMLLQILLSGQRMQGLQHVLGVMVLFGILVYFYRASRHVGDLMWPWVGLIGGTVSAVGGLVFLTQQDTLPYINPNAYAFFPLGGIVAGALAAAASRHVSLLQWALVGTNITLVFLTGSRGGFLIAITVTAMMFLMTRRIQKRLIAIVITLAIVVVLSSQYLHLQERTLERFDKLFNTDLSLLERTGGRSELTKGALYLLVENPLGIGTGGFSTALASIEGLPEFKFSGRALQAHSAWLKVTVENGIPGAVLLAYFVLSFVVAGWRTRRHGMFLPGMLATVAICLAFILTEFQVKPLWLLVAGTMTMTYRYHQRRGAGGGEYKGQVRANPDGKWSHD